VNVQQAGKYDVSSNWACESAECGLSIWFNDGVSGSDNAGKPLDGKNKSGVVKFEGTKDYHKWRAYPKFAQVELTAGPQVMTFHVEVANHLQYGFLQFDLVGGNPSGGTGGAGGSSPGGASAGGSNNAGSGGALGSGGTAGNLGAGGTTGTLPAGSAGTGSSAAGAPASGTAGASAAGAGAVGTTDTTTDSGCAVTTAPRGARTPGSVGVLLLGAFAMLLRRRAR
jgi:MYXO-CTERM domain-containing protein